MLLIESYMKFINTCGCASMFALNSPSQWLACSSTSLMFLKSPCVKWDFLLFTAFKCFGFTF